MVMPGRKHSIASLYSLGFNAHVRDFDIDVNGNHNTALYGEYESRLGRRWNLDPKPNPSVSIYAVFANNPIWFNDILLDTPTVKEAALMSKLVYGDKLSADDQSEFNKSGWKLSSKVTGVEYSKKSGLKSALYERTIGGKTEYTYVFAGTEDLVKDGVADVKQVLGASKQYDEAIQNSREITKQLGSAELTFTGHSLGGGLANASALATGKASLTFNPAWVSTATMLRYGLLFKSQRAINNYVVFGEVLNSVQRATNPSPIPTANLLQNVGQTHYLYAALPWIPLYGPLKSHSIDKVIEEIKDVKEYNKVKGYGGAGGTW
jgi:hypothetical protein